MTKEPPCHVICILENVNASLDGLGLDAHAITIPDVTGIAFVNSTSVNASMGFSESQQIVLVCFLLYFSRFSTFAIVHKVRRIVNN